MIQKLRRQSVKASSIKGKLGLGSKASTYRSRSFIVPSPTPEHHLEMERYFHSNFYLIVLVIKNKITYRYFICLQP